MTSSGFLRSKKWALTCVTVLLAGTPLFGWAQGTATKPTPAPAAPPPTTTSPTPAAAKDSVAKDSVAKAAAAVTGAATVPAALSDSARAALRSEIERELKTLADSLKLTPDQRAKSRPILLDQAYQVRNLRQKYATQQRTPEVLQAMQMEMQGLRDSSDARLGQVLTAHQMTQYKMKRDAWLGQTRTRLGTGGAAPAASGAAPAAQPPADTARKSAAGAPADTAKKK